MTTAISPLNFLAGFESLGTPSEGWILDQAPSGTGPRTFRSHIRFERPFGVSPLVHLGIAGFDICNQDCARVTSRVENVSATGFDIVLSTWLHTRLWRVDVNWLAIGT